LIELATQSKQRGMIKFVLGAKLPFEKHCHALFTGGNTIYRYQMPSHQSDMPVMVLISSLSHLG
jgi:hypothetical protein